jgi:hypothetical protein
MCLCVRSLPETSLQASSASNKNLTQRRNGNKTQCARPGTDREARQALSARFARQSKPLDASDILEWARFAPYFHCVIA